jgi:hypothetical protein
MDDSEHDVLAYGRKSGKTCAYNSVIQRISVDTSSSRDVG